MPDDWMSKLNREQRFRLSKARAVVFAYLMLWGVAGVATIVVLTQSGVQGFQWVAVITVPLALWLLSRTVRLFDAEVQVEKALEREVTGAHRLPTDSDGWARP